MEKSHLDIKRSPATLSLLWSHQSHHSRANLHIASVAQIPHIHWYSQWLLPWWILQRTAPLDPQWFCTSNMIRELHCRKICHDQIQISPHHHGTCGIKMILRCQTLRMRRSWKQNKMSSSSFYSAIEGQQTSQGCNQMHICSQPDTRTRAGEHPDHG